MGNTVIVDIRENAFPEVEVQVGTYVVWRNLDPFPHTVETDGGSSFFFNVGALATGDVSSPVLFNKPGEFAYLCRYHAEMAGTVRAVAAQPSGGAQSSDTSPHAGHDHGHGHGGHSHLQHFHGFVTGGRTGSKLYMSHTPVIADERHQYQVILQGSFVKPEHEKIYAELRQTYGDGKMQIFHDHLALPDIGNGTIKELPEANVEYYPNGDAGEPVPGLEEGIPVRIDKVLHFHQFEPDTDYPPGLEYIVYGDSDDVFIDHHITRAPNFHSIAKLASAPKFWSAVPQGESRVVLVPSKQITDVSPKIIRRAAFVDNAFHLFWLAPSGIYSPQPQDPLKPRDGGKAIYEVRVLGGGADQMEIGRWIHFDVRLLNNRVVIT